MRKVYSPMATVVGLALFAWGCGNDSDSRSDSETATDSVLAPFGGTEGADSLTIGTGSESAAVDTAVVETQAGDTQTPDTQAEDTRGGDTQGGGTDSVGTEPGDTTTAAPSSTASDTAVDASSDTGGPPPTDVVDPSGVDTALPLGRNANSAVFVHPGITHKQSDLDRIAAMVEAKVDPWYSSFQEMAADSKSRCDYEVRGDPSFTVLGRDDGTNYGAWNSDIRAAYYNALLWVVTKEECHAQKAVEIFNAWRNLKAVTSNGTEALSGGVGYIMIEAAEIIKSTYDGWSQEDQQAFKDMLVYPGYSNTEVPDTVSRTNGTFYWKSYQGDPGRHGNQGLSGWRTVMAMGIFLDNEIMYERALRYIQGLPHRPDDLPYPSGPPTSTELLSSTDYVDTYATKRGDTIEDYGYNEVLTHYVWENGQCQESSRDQQHVFFGLGLLVSMSEMSWNQGRDLYGHADNRLLLGLEYSSRYGVSAIATYPDQPEPWEPSVEDGTFLQRFDRTGRWFSKAISPDGRGGFPGVRPLFEMAVGHYVGRDIASPEDAKWTVRARDVFIEKKGYEKAGWTNDHLGWGTLTARRPPGCPGDPIRGFDENGLPVYGMHTLPGDVEAELFDYMPVPTYAPGRTYSDTTEGNQGGAFRPEEDVDIELCRDGGFDVGWIDDGEWLTYTVYVSAPGSYDVAVRYAAVADGGVLRIFFDGQDVTGAVALPATGGTQQWQERTVATGVRLDNKVQAMRIVAQKGGFNLDRIRVIAR